ncbi:MAG: tRNA guanosine(15) transglycosylase TgtA [Candidatus Methanomethyliaceae archaeon]|nr:tRNA guanosine(15) transglycosylase TgtA [Candidatus Methanomethyliaceae archaeon]
MCFEVKERDLAGRIGLLRTRRGVLETPTLMPVVNPVKNTISPSELKEEFGFNLIITNAYIILKHYGKDAKDVHEITGFDGTIMTDSGAYQLLIYGGIDTTPEEIVRFQERIHSDIGVILDVPTGGFANREEAEQTVRETIRRAKESISWREDGTMLWAGPIQGGRYLDLVEECARAMGDLDFQIHPLGSPTQIMEGYDYQTLVDMIVTAKRVLPPERPLHLFGAGHPMMLSLAVALGCDLFDSAAYALFAKDGRYMTQVGTMRVDELEELPCSCPICVKRNVEDLVEVPKEERVGLLARHNLYIVVEELRSIRESIREGTLWEHLESRCRTHPKLYEGMKRLSEYKEYLEYNDPIINKTLRGLFFYDEVSMFRPEVYRYKERIFSRYSRPKGKDILILMPMPDEKPFNRSKIYKLLKKTLENRDDMHICFYGDPFGVVPSELSETFPLSQFESAIGLGRGWRESVEAFLASKGYREAFILGERVKGAKTIDSIEELERLSDFLEERNEGGG